MKITPLRSFIAISTLCAVAIACSLPAFSYLPMLVSSAGVAHTSHWDFSAFPVTWSLNPSTGTNITGTRTVAGVVQASFDTWVAAPNTTIVVSRGADSALTAGAFDGVNLICFVCTGDFATEADTLAVTTSFTSNAVGQATKHGGTSTFIGQMLDADILFNPTSTFTTGGGTAQDLQTIATHEIGHFLGLDHSAVVRAIMFPFAANSLNSLGSDDVAGISSLYPSTPQTVPVGSISGTVRLTTGTAIFGAHVFADSTTGATHYGPNIRKTPIGAMTNPDGTYSMVGVPIDSYVVTAEPLDQPVANSNISGFASTFGRAAVQTNFNTRWH